MPSSRQDMDRPATVLVAVVGVVLIAASLPFLILDQGGKTRYDVAWSEATAAASPAAAFGNNGQPAQTAPVTATGDLSNVTVVMESCNDNRGPGNVAPAAAITWELFKDGASYQSGTAQCTPGEVQSMALHAHPDVGSVRAGSQAAAAEKVWEDHVNQTHEFYLRFQYVRGGNTNGLPIPGVQPTFSGSMSLEVLKWVATVNEQQAGVGK